jgi:hypothetical protein
MTPERENELTVLGSALGQLVEGSTTSADPVLAGGLCVLHRSNTVSLVSVEAPDAETGTLITMAVALLAALVGQEQDPRVLAKLQKALKAATEAQIARVTPATNMRVN